MDMNELMKSEDYTRNFDIQDISANKLMGVLSYLGILVLVPIFTSRNSRFAMFHAEQGLTLAICEIITGAVLGILGAFIPVVGFIFFIILSILELVFFLLAVIGIVNSANGQAKEVPVFGKFRLIKLQ